MTELLDLLGWQWVHIRPSMSGKGKWMTSTSLVGWPDIFAWHPDHARVIAVELKSQTGQPTPDQVSVLDSLARAGLETYVWRPSNFDDLQAVLTAKERP